jgi:hypothetical protein
MGIKRRKRQRLTDEEKASRLDIKLKRVISKAAEDLALRDEDASRQMVAQTFGFKLADREEKSRTELVTFLNELAIEELKKNPDLAQRIAQAMIRREVQELGLRVEGDDWIRKPYTMDDMIRDSKKVNELKQVLGVKESAGWLEALLNPQVVKGILGLLTKMIGGGGQAYESDGGLIRCSIDGEEKLLTPEEFAKLVAQRDAGALDKATGNAGKEGPADKSGDNNNEGESENSSEAGEGEKGTNTGCLGA